MSDPLLASLVDGALHVLDRQIQRPIGGHDEQSALPDKPTDRLDMFMRIEGLERGLHDLRRGHTGLARKGRSAFTREVGANVQLSRSGAFHVFVNITAAPEWLASEGVC